VLSYALKEKFQFKKNPIEISLMNQKNSEQNKISRQIRINSEQNKIPLSKQIRFNQVSGGSKLSTLREELNDLNVFIVNTEVGIKQNPQSGSQEQEVYPVSANANTYFSYSYSIWKNIFYYPPSEAINHFWNYKFWMSKDNVNEDFIEFHFAEPTKLNTMTINWRLAPKRFKVEFRVKANGALIPVTEMVYKFKDIEDDGSRGSISKVLDQDSLMFNKPIFAKSVKISMWEPLKSRKFSISKVKFWNEKYTLLIQNKTFDSCKNFCLYINTNKPISGTKVEAMNCLSGMSTGDNRELWTLNANNSLNCFNKSNLCLSEDRGTKDIILKECGPLNPFYLHIKNDDTLSFRGYDNECIGMDTSTDQSPNFISKDTELIVTSEYDDEVYKKENVTSKFYLIL